MSVSSATRIALKYIAPVGAAILLVDSLLVFLGNNLAILEQLHLVVAGVMLVWLFIILRRELRARYMAMESLRTAYETLDIRVKERTAELEDANGNLQLLCNSALHLLREWDDEEIFDYIGRQVADLHENSIVLVSEYLHDTHASIVRSVFGNPEETRQLAGFLGGGPVGKELKFDLCTFARRSASNLRKLEGGLVQVSFCHLPEKTCTRIESEMHFDAVFVMPIMQGDDILGSVAILSHQAMPPDDTSVIEASVNQAAAVLRHLRLEKEQEQIHAEAEHQRDRAENLARTLEEERNVLHAIMENTQTQLAYLDRDMRFIWVNSAYTVGSGYEKEALLGRNHFEIFPDPENLAIFTSVRDTGEPVRYNAKPFEFADQPWRGITYWDWTLVPIRNAAGKVNGLVMSLTDVTDEQRAKTRREELLARLHALIRVSKKTLREQTVDTLFQTIADAAREITCARVSLAGHAHDSGNFHQRTSTSDLESPLCSVDPAAPFESTKILEALLMDHDVVRLTETELLEHPLWHGVPTGHFPVRGLLAVRMKLGMGTHAGLIMVTDKRSGDFDQEDEALLSELAALASLSLQHIRAREEAEHRANELGAIFAAMTNAVIVYDTEGVVTRANAAVVRILGMNPVGLSLADMFAQLQINHDEGRPFSLEEIPTQRALAGEVVHDERIVLTSVDGIEHIILSSSTPIRIGETLIGAVTLWTDMTERERLIRELVVERAKLKAIIDNVPGGIVVVDERAQSLIVNPEAERLYLHQLVRGEAEMMSSMLEFLYESGQPYQAPDLPLARSAMYGEEHRDVELQVRWPDGEHRHILTNSAPIRDSAGNLSGAVGMFQDITQRKHMEEALMQREQEYQLLMEQASDAIYIIDNDGKIIATNSRACAMLGYEQEELLYMDWSRFVVTDNLLSIIASVRNLEPGANLLAEHRLRRRNGELIHVETSACRLSDGRFQAIVRDITDRKKMEAEFSRAIQTHAFDRLFNMLMEFQHGQVMAMNLHRLSLFARNLKLISNEATGSGDPAHVRLEAAVNEFRTLTHPKLLGIASLLRTVERDLESKGLHNGERPSGADIQSRTEKLFADTETLIGIIHQPPGAAQRQHPKTIGGRIAEHVDALSRTIIDVMRQLNERFKTPPQGVVESVAETFRFKHPDVPIEVVNDGCDVMALISAAELAEVMALIIGNAFDSFEGVGSEKTKRRKRVIVRLSAREGRVRIAIDDTGAGVPAEIRARIFEKGFSTKGESHGFGLDYARNHVRKFGGELTCEERPGGGARFVIDLVGM